MSGILSLTLIRSTCTAWHRATEGQMGREMWVDAKLNIVFGNQSVGDET